MPQKHYSPEIRRDLVTKLYYRAKAERVPMTKLTNRLLDEALQNIVPFIPQQSPMSIVAENPDPPSAA